MNSDEIRATWFLLGNGGYDAPEVHDLLHRAATELDAGRLVGPVIENITFQATGGYDIDAVDWFLEQLLLYPSHSEPAEISTDPWHGLGVVSYFTWDGVSDPAQRPAKPPWRDLRRHFSEECANGWRDFGQEPGTHLQWRRAGRRRFELRTTEQQTIASHRAGWSTTVTAGGRSFALKNVKSSSPDIAEIAARSTRDYVGHFAAKTTRSDRGLVEASLMELVDAAGVPILYVSASIFFQRACASISFPDGRWLRFLIRGTDVGNAIMTAVDQAGNRVARYRIIPGSFSRIGPVEIIVHPDWALTDELVLAITMSADWLGSYFSEGGGG